MSKVNDFLWGSTTDECTIKDSYIISKSTLKAYRIFSCIAMIAMYFWIAQGQGRMFLPLQYLTNWGMTLGLLYFVGVSYCYIVYKNDDHASSENPNAFWKLVVMLGETSFCMQVLIVPYFWILLYPKMAGTYEGTMFLQTVCSHGGAAALIWIEIMFNKTRFYKRHIFVVLLFGLMYIAINGIYTKMTGRLVYSNLTWKSIATLYYILASLFVVCIGFWIGMALTKLKFRKNEQPSGIEYYLVVINLIVEMKEFYSSLNTEKDK